DPLVSGGSAAEQRGATAQADPLNKQIWDCRPNSSKYACSSAAELPGAVPQPWIAPRPDTGQGRVETRTITSAIQRMDRQVSIYQPPGHRPGGASTALLVLFDGETYLDRDLATTTTLDNLIAAGKIPPTTAVFVPTGGARRLQDLVASDEFADFVSKELVPFVTANYNVSRDPARAVVGGFSAGGLAGAYVGLRHPEVF